MTRHTALLNELSGVYQVQFNKRFRLGMSMVDSNGVFLQSSNPAVLLEELDDLVRAWLNGLQDLCSHLDIPQSLFNVAASAIRPGPI